MAFLKFSFFFIAALFVCQITASPYVENVEDKKAEDLAKLVGEVTSFFKKVLDAGEKFLSTLIKDDINKFQKDTVQVTLKVLGKFKAYFDKLLDAVAPQLNADAKKVSKCLEDNSYSIINVIVDYYNQTTLCFNPGLEAVLTKVLPLLQDLEKVDNDAAVLAPEIAKCDNDICLTKKTASSYIGNVEDKKAENFANLVVNVTSFFKKILDIEEKIISTLIKDGIDKFQKDTVDVTLKVLDKFKTYFDKLLDAVAPQLNADAKKVSKCLEDNSNSIINVIVDYYNQTTLCFNPGLKTVLGKVLPLLQDLEKIDEDAAVLAPEISKCDSDICLIRYLRDLLVDVGTLPAVLKKDVPVILDSVKAFIKTTEECATKTAVPWKKEAASLFNKVATCMRS